MIKVFLVEDEVVIRNGIKNSIEWEKEGYEFVGEASDGELAYPMILEKKPDILITDIKMPFMDGLELSRLVKEALPDIQILILSGYDEFEYAKEAIRLKVAEYLLKPVSSVKLLKVLRDVSDSIYQEREEKELLEQYAKEMQENTEQEKLKFFGYLIDGNKLSKEEAVETGRKYDMDLRAGAFNILLFKLLATAENYKQPDVVQHVYEAIDQVVEEIPYVCSFQRGIDGWGFLLTAADEAQMEERTGAFARKLAETMGQYESLAYYGGIGKSVSDLGDLRESFREADKAFAGRFMQENNRISTGKDMLAAHEDDAFKLSEFGATEKTRMLIEKFLNNGMLEEIESFAKACVAEVTEDNFRSLLMRQYIIMDIYIVVMSFCEKMGVPKLELEEKSDKLKSRIGLIQTLDELEEYLIPLLSEAIEFRNEVSGRRYSDIIESAKAKINEMYMSDDISLNAVAVSVGMSPSYFSSVFSREVGKTFVEYLTEIRMDKAKELLTCSPMKTSEIGYEVGYKDPHYFSYIFKKTQGCSPKEYRARRKG